MSSITDFALGSTGLWVVIGIGINELVGCFVLSQIDRGDQLYNWCKACPLGFWLPVMFWPAVTIAWYYLKWTTPSSTPRHRSLDQP